MHLHFESGSNIKPRARKCGGRGSVRTTCSAPQQVAIVGVIVPEHRQYSFRCWGP